MNQVEVVELLSRLLQTLCRSLPMYLQEAKPWTRHDDEPIRAALDCLASDQQAAARRVADAIVDQGGQPDPGCFPVEFTAINDVSIHFLLSRMVQNQEQAVATIQQCVDRLAELPLLHSLAEEIHGNVQGHLDILKRLQGDAQATGVSA
ncbi:MAG TPA: hypothetical protein VE890_06425 [Thermoguttaceae bacterium]|nr:hypothetical protein [Thermoguttaceae bacterium]